VWSAAECADLVAAAVELASTSGRRAPVMNPHRDDPRFLAALRHRAVVAIVERLVGGPAVGLQTQLFYCPPGTPGFSMHQDNYYVQAPPAEFTSAWIALEDVDAENGGLILWPGTHREPVLPVADVVAQRRSPTQDPNANAREVVLPPGYEPIAPAVPRGAVVFLHGHLVHASADNRSAARTRHALLATYVRCGAPFRPGRDAGRAAVALAGDAR
jgi:ectoine hydroxylase-related dioxygenase (phytanoyl-CoA dioxygenase family)